MQWMGGAKRYAPTQEALALIVDTYVTGLSVAATHREVLRLGHQVTEACVSATLREASVMRNKRQLKGALTKPVYTATKECMHCGEKFMQAFARHIYCDACAPDGKFAKYITKYGIGRREYDAMLIAQNNRCAICNKLLDMGKDTHVDHDHITKAVRGLLCNVCNTRVGVLEDSMFTQKAGTYLEARNDFRRHART